MLFTEILRLAWQLFMLHTVSRALTYAMSPARPIGDKMLSYRKETALQGAL